MVYSRDGTCHKNDRYSLLYFLDDKKYVYSVRLYKYEEIVSFSRTIQDKINFPLNSHTRFCSLLQSQYSPKIQQTNK